MRTSLFNRIDRELKNGCKILVCCQQGKDRSAAILTMYLMTKYYVPWNKAFNYIKSKRLIVTTDSYPEYIKLLIQLENKIKRL